MEEDNKSMYQMRFPQKLWYLISIRNDAILWGGTGRTILLNYKVLHNYLQCDNSVFKTNNISSFVRQLNLYGFRKVTSHLQDPLCNSSNPFMHEYMHDYFQFGMPELLNKITRKALNIKKNIKHRSICNHILQPTYITPLQKARRALRVALKKAAQDLYIQHSTLIGCEDGTEESCDDEEYIDLEMFYSKSPSRDINLIESDPQPHTNEKENGNNNESFSDIQEHNIMDFNEVIESEKHDGGTFPTQFLSMPDLDPEPVEDTHHGIELLGEFHINNDIDENVTRKVRDKTKDKENDKNSLNCVLPSINTDENDDVIETKYDTGHYHGEWEQMFNDIINRGQNQEYSSDLKELYSQISKTIDLLNS